MTSPLTSWNLDPQHLATALREGVTASLEGMLALQNEARKMTGKALAEARKEGADASSLWNQRVDDLTATAFDLQARSLTWMRDEVSRLGKVKDA